MDNKTTGALILILVGTIISMVLIGRMPSLPSKMLEKYRKIVNKTDFYNYIKTSYKNWYESEGEPNAEKLAEDQKNLAIAQNMYEQASEIDLKNIAINLEKI